MAEKKPGTVSIIYDQIEGRPSFPVGGAYGGPTPDNTQVVAHVYSEFVTVPALDELDIAADGTAKTSQGHQIKRSDITRRVLATLVMPPEVAVVVGKWLVSRGQLALQNRQKASK